MLGMLDDSNDQKNNKWALATTATEKALLSLYENILNHAAFLTA